MKSFVFILALLAVAVPAFAESSKVVVLSTRAERGSTRELAGTVTQLVVDAVAKADGLRATGEADISAFLDDASRKQLASCDDDAACLIEIGGALDAEYFLSTSLGALGESYMLSLRLLSSREGVVVARASRRLPRSENALADGVCPLVHALLSELSRRDARVRADPARCEPAPPPAAAPVAVAVPPEPLVAVDVPPARTPESPAPRAATATASVAVRAELDVGPPLAASLSTRRSAQGSAGGTFGLALAWGTRNAALVGTLLFPSAIGARLEGRLGFGEASVRPYASAGVAVFRDALGLRAAVGLERTGARLRLFADAAYELYPSRSESFNVNPLLLAAGAAYAF